MHFTSNGRKQISYQNYVCQPYYEVDPTQPAGVIVIGHDVTSNVKTNEELAENKQSLELATEIAQLGVFHVDLNTNTARYSEQTMEWFGFTEQNLPMAEVLSKVHPQDRSKVAETIALSTAVSSNHRHDFTYRLISPKSGRLLYLRSIGQVKFENGVALSISGIIQDVTREVIANKKIEEKVFERTKELAEATKQLQHSNTELNQFAYIASHDLQEPLRKVRTFIELMQLSLEEVPEKTKGYIDKITASTERMQTLVKDILKFSLLSKEREKFEYVDLNFVLRNILDDYELFFEQKEAKIKVDILPVIEAIPVQINQLFTNLISNALKFSKKEKAPEITIKAKRLTKEEVQQQKELDKEKLYYLIEFTDNGIGFDQKYSEQIFAIFKRLHGKLEYQGTGIGLAMCRRIVQNHQGKIFANSKPDQGTSFIIILPQT